MEKADSGAEKRRFKRIEKKFVVTLRVYSDKKTTLAAKYDIVSLKNISAGGALFAYNKELKIGTLVDLNIASPMLAEPVACLGRIIRVEPPSQSMLPGQIPLYNIAVRFIETMDRKEQGMINNIVEGYLSREKGAKE